MNKYHLFNPFFLIGFALGITFGAFFVGLYAAFDVVEDSFSGRLW